MDFKAVVTIGDRNRVRINDELISDIDVFIGDTIRLVNNTENPVFVFDRQAPAVVTIESTGSRTYELFPHSDLTTNIYSTTDIYEFANAPASAIPAPHTDGKAPRTSIVVTVGNKVCTENEEYSIDRNVIDTTGVGTTTRIAFRDSSVPAPGEEIKVLFDTYRLCEGFCLPGNEIRVPIVQSSPRSLYVAVANITDRIRFVVREKNDRRFVDDVTGLIPSASRGESPRFEQFVADFMDFAKIPGNPLDVLTQHGENIDITRNPDRLSVINDVYLSGFPKVTKASRDLVVRKSNDFYNTRGTLDSFSFYGRVAFDIDVEYASAKPRMFAASSSQWIEDISVHVKPIRSFLTSTPSEAQRVYDFFGSTTYKDPNQFGIHTDLLYLEGTTILGAQSGATGVVESVIQTVVGNEVVTDLRVSRLTGSFITHELILFQSGIPDEVLTVIGPINLNAVCVNQVVSFKTDGMNYTVGDVISIPAKGGEAYVRKVKDGSPSRLVIINPGYGINDGEAAVVSDKFGSVKGSATAVTGPVRRIPGYRKTTGGNLSDRFYRLQDNYYIQRYAYELVSSFDRTIYETTFKAKMHPAGYQMFTKNVKFHDPVIYAGNPSETIEDAAKNLSSLPDFRIHAAFNDDGDAVDFVQGVTNTFDSSAGLILIGQNTNKEGAVVSGASTTLNTAYKFYEDTQYDQHGQNIKYILDTRTAENGTSRAMLLVFPKAFLFNLGTTIIFAGDRGRVFFTLKHKNENFVLVQPENYASFLGKL